MSVAQRRFRQNLEQEIKRRSKTQDYDMQKEEIEAIGINAGLPRDQVEQKFLNLAGKAWAGYIYPDDGLCIWVSGPRSNPLPHWGTVVFEPSWFQERGIWR